MLVSKAKRHGEPLVAAIAHRVYRLSSRMQWLLLIALSLLSAANLKASSAPHRTSVVVAYVFPQDSLILPGEISARKLTRINYAFANLQGGRIVSGFTHDDQNLAALVVLKQENPALTVLVSVGGWLWSGNFSDMALSRQSRGIFIESAVDFLTRHQLDGLDIDWEYPGMAGAESHFRPEDKQNYTLLLKELRARFDREEKTLHRRLYLTIATGASQEFIAHTEMEKVQKYVDSVNLMAYDYYEPSSDAVTGNHAPLFSDPADPKKASADASLHEYEQAGVPADKIVLGVPFYGHIWGTVPDENHGLFQPGKPVPNASAQYGDIAGMLRSGYTRYWDSASSVPFLYNPESKMFVSYEDPEALALKCKYAIAHGLKGIMFWDYEADPTGALLNAINAGINGKPGAPDGKQ
jgi:chitinase